MGRAPCCEKVGLKKGRWTAEEDEILTKYIQANGEGSWRSLPKNAGLLRCGKSCRLRWINYLRADLKRGNISSEEEDVIVKLHSSYGNRWSLIATHLPGRTDNEIKNYWNSHLSRKIYSFRRAESTDTTPPEIIKIPIPPKPKGGKTSRWAMKKNKSLTQKDYKQRPKQSATQHNNEPSVPLPPTPSLESEGFCSALADFMALDPNVEDMAESAQVSYEPVISSNGETHKGEGPESLFCSGGVNEGLDQEVQCPYEKENDGIVGPCQVEGINGGGGALSFGDMMEGNLLEACGVLTIISEEREISNDVVGVGEDNERGVACLEQMVTGEDPESSVNLSSGESGEWYKYSCFPMELDLDENWDWDSLMELNDRDNDNNIESDAWEHKENLLTWLWEDDDWGSSSNELGKIDPEKQDDMLAWLLSS